MARENVFLNADGLNVGFGTRTVAENEAQKIATQGAIEQVVFDLNDAVALDLTTLDVSSDAVVHGAEIPANSLILSAKLVVKTLFASGGAPTLDIGTYDSAGAPVDANGLFAATALGALTLNAVIDGAGAQVGAVVTQAVRIGASRNVAAYTAGQAQVVVEYQPQV